jgi:hypothetical protein
MTIGDPYHFIKKDFEVRCYRYHQTFFPRFYELQNEKNKL